MAQHTITLNDLQEKGLAYANDKRNATLDPKADPPQIPLTVDEYLQFVLGPVADDWARQAGISTAEPIIEKLKEAIAAADDAKIQAVKDALGIVAVAVDPVVLP
jgi:hypothetical protein